MQPISVSQAPERTAAAQPARGEVHIEIFRQMRAAEPAWRGFEAG